MSLLSARDSARLMLVAAAGLLFAAVASAATLGSFLDADQAFRPILTRSDTRTARLSFEIAPGYYLYRERLNLRASPALAQGVNWPAGKRKFDENLDIEVETFHDHVEVSIPLPQGDEVALDVSYQGCAEKGLCYPPQRKSYRILASTPLGVPIAEESGATSRGTSRFSMPMLPSAERPREPDHAPGDSPATRLDGALQAGRLGAVLVAFFVAGILLSATPCVWAMLPILMAVVITGASHRARKRRGGLLSGSYSMGLVVACMTVGVAATVRGDLVPTLVGPFVMLALALWALMQALTTLASMDRRVFAERRIRALAGLALLHGRSLIGAFAAGCLSVLIVERSEAVPWERALAYLSQAHDFWVGGVALFGLSMGIAVPLLLIGATTEFLLTRGGAFVVVIGRVVAFSLLGVAAWMAVPATEWVMQWMA